jgi:hypothetical protein
MKFNRLFILIIGILLSGCVTTNERIASVNSQDDMSLCVDWLTDAHNRRVRDVQATEISRRRLNCSQFEEIAKLKIEAKRMRSQAIDRSIRSLQDQADRMKGQEAQRNQQMRDARPITCTSTRMGAYVNTQCF